MNRLFYLWRDFIFRSDVIDDSIDKDDEDPPTIKRWKWKQIKDTKTQRNHRCQHKEITNMDTTVRKSNKYFHNSHWSSNARSDFLLLFMCSRTRKRRRNDGSESTKRKYKLFPHFTKSILDRTNRSIFIPNQWNIRSNICADLPLIWTNNDVYFFEILLFHGLFANV